MNAKNSNCWKCNASNTIPFKEDKWVDEISDEYLNVSLKGKNYFVYFPNENKKKFKSQRKTKIITKLLIIWKEKKNHPLIRLRLISMCRIFVWLLYICLNDDHTLMKNSVQ